MDDFHNDDVLSSPIVNRDSDFQFTINAGDDFDVDDIVKKIDAKIAQLEKEEEEAKKQEALANKKESDLDLNTVINSPKAQAENNDNLDKLINSNKPVVDVKPIDDKPIDNKKDTPAKGEKDDDFFDDFFDE